MSITSDSDAEGILQWLLDNKIVKTRFDSMQGQMIEITKLGARINDILEHMRKVDKV